MKLITCDDLNSGYAELASHLLENGRREVRRGNLEMLEDSVVLELTDPRNRIVTNKARKLSPFFLVGEFLWILAGRNDVKSVAAYNARMRDFSDDGVTLYGAYGPRIHDQLINVIELLRRDKNTRQAVISIHRPEDSSAVTKDFPCNLTLHLQIENGRLCWTTFIRSQDLLWGFPYDVFHWTMLQEVVAVELEVPLGSYRHVMPNVHIYPQTREWFRDVIDAHRSVGTHDGLMDPMLTSPFGLEQYHAILAEFERVTLHDVMNGREIYDYALRDVDRYWLNFLDVCAARHGEWSFYDEAHDIFDPALRRLVDARRNSD